MSKQKICAITIRGEGSSVRFGQLALVYGNKTLPLEVLRSGAGYYIGTFDHDAHCPFSRESAEYFPSREEAEHALQSGDWTQRTEP